MSGEKIQARVRAALRPPKLPWPLRYAAAPLSVLLVVVVQRAIFLQPSVTPFVFFTVAVALTSWLGGRGPGFVATALSAVAGNYFFLAPYGQVDLTGPGLLATALFVIAGVTISLLSGSLLMATAEADEKARLLNAALSERMATQESLRASEERLRFARAAAHLGVYDHDLATGRIEWDERMRELWGVGPTAPVSWELFISGVHPDDRPAILRAIEGAHLSHGQYEVEYRVTNLRDGLERWVKATGHVSFEDSRPVRHVGTVEDVTERKRAERALQDKEAQLREAQRLAGLGSWEWTVGSSSITWSEGLHLILGRDLALGAPTFEALPKFYTPESWERLKPAIARAAETGAPYELELEMVRDDGTTCWAMTRGEAVRGPAGAVVKLRGTVHDISKRKKLDDAFREEERRKNEFLGMLSHELRNPLTPIRNSLYILERAAPGGEQARRAQSVIDRQVSHLARLVDDLLDVTRIGRGKIRLQRTSLDLAEVVRRTIEDHRGSLEEHEVAVELPNEAIPVDGDPTRLAQVVGNLLTNAAKFTPRGGKISVSLKRAQGRAVLVVADTGIGIDQDTLRRLFEPFAQADRSLDRSRGGLGLGLALVKGLVELHGGEVSAHSDGPGKGARFTLTFPLDEHAAAMPGLLPSPAAAGPGRRVLVIEDNRDAADSLVEALSLSGHQVAVAYDGEAGVAKARESRPEIVLCDIGLPAGMDGYAVARTLRRDPLTASAYLVALTGYAQPEDHRRALDAGFDVHLAKPPDLAVLERLLAQAPTHGPQVGGEAAVP